MHCREVKILLPDYSSRALDEAAAAEIREHLAGCAGCSLEAERLNRLFSTVLHRSAPESPVDWASFGVRLNEHLDDHGSRKALYARPAFAYTTVAVLLLGMLSILYVAVLPDSVRTNSMLFSDMEKALGSEFLETLYDDTIDDIMLLPRTDVSSFASGVDIAALDEPTVLAIDEMYLSELGNGELLSATEYLHETEAFEALPRAVADEVFSALESKNFFND